jgi:peptidoglycan-associated lipoprotein
MYSGLSVALVVVLAACGGYVKKDDLAAQMAEVQNELGQHETAIQQNSSDIALMQADIDQLRADMDAMAEEMSAMIEEMEDGLRFAMPVHFDFDDANIRATDQANLDRFAGVVSQYYPGVLVTVEGFADPAGSAEYNKWLSQKRAENVAGYLVANSTLDVSAVKAVGYGESRQVRPGAWGPEGLDNRRVTFVVEYATPAMDGPMSATSN